MEDTQIVPERKNPLLVKLHKIPGSSFRLPSKGLFYKNGELDAEVEDGEVVVHSMTATDELMMKSPDMLFQGTAICNVIGRCVPQIKKPDELLVADVDFLLTCLRKVSYGKFVSVTHTCGMCDVPLEIEYKLLIDHFINNTKEVTQADYDDMKMTLNNMYEFKFKPCTFLQMVKILQAGQQLNATSKPEVISAWVADSVTAVVRSVDGIHDKDDIRELITKLPIAMRTELAIKVTTLNNWGPEFKYKTKCLGDCGNEIELSTSINPTNFFMQPSG